MHCRLYEEDGSEETVLYVEQWESEEDLQRHIRSDLYRRILEAMELSCRSPEVAFHSVSATAGMELIEALRGAAGAVAESSKGSVLGL